MTIDTGFKPIPGYPHYLIDRNGNVFSLKTHRYLVESDNGFAFQIRLCKPKSCCSKRCHRCRPALTISYLLLLTFVGPPPPYHQAYHLDGDYRNNELGNLEWRPKAEISRENGMLSHGANSPYRGGPRART